MGAVTGASNDAQMTWLFERLDLAVYLTIAWTAASATGRDFARPGTEIARMFGPHREHKTHPTTVNVQS